MGRSIIFFSGGLGNALLAQPLVKKLKERGETVSGIFTTNWGGYEIYTQMNLLDEHFQLAGKRDLAAFGMKRIKKYDTVYLDYFSAGRKNLLLANMIGKRIVSNRVPSNIPRFLRPLIHFKRPGIFLHEGAQYLKLMDRSFEESQLTEALFQFPDLTLKKENHLPPKLKGITNTIIPVQPVGGNNLAPYKSWPIESWRAFFEKAATDFPDCTFVLLGDQNEKTTGTALEKKAKGNVISIAGETQLSEVIAVLQSAPFYLGIDSGLMHLSVALGLPTLTIWGGSDHRLFGYRKIAAERHVILHKQPPCWPCNAYLAPNTTRVEDPSQCPDFKCIRQTSVEEALENFAHFYKKFRQP